MGRIGQFIFLFFTTIIFALSGNCLAESKPDTKGTGYAANPYSGMYGSMGNVYSPYYRQFHGPSLAGMAGMGPPTGMAGTEYPFNPYSGMYGSMGNVYSPYYRQFHGPGMAGISGMGPPTGMAGTEHPINPYSGMYGSMGNVYSPYYRQFHMPR